MNINSKRMAEQYNDEIDLTQLMVKIKNVLIRNTLLIITLTLSGLLLGLGFFLLKPSVYQSAIVIRAGIMNEPLLSMINGSLTRTIEENNIESLSSKLEVSPEVADSIVKINIKPAGEEDSNNSNFYLISVESLSNENWKELEHGILTYLANNEYVQKRIATQEERYKVYINQLDSEIRQLDSLKLNLTSTKLTGSNSFIVMNPSDVYATLIDLYKQRQEYKEDLAYNTAVEIVENFEAYQQPVSPRPVFSMGVGALIGLVFSFLIIAAKEMDGYLKKYEE